MNKRRMEALAKFIEKLPPEHFNMSEWIQNLEEEDKMCKKDILNSCGTACCIAGWQALKAGYCLAYGGDIYDKKTGEPAGHSNNFTRDYLELTPDQAYNLFRRFTWPYAFKVRPDSPQLAAERIRYMIRTGE